MNEYRFRLDISADEYLDYYRGMVKHVIAPCSTGQNVQFPASLLQRHVLKDGIHGDFVLTTDANNKCIELRRA